MWLRGQRPGDAEEVATDCLGQIGTFCRCHHAGRGPQGALQTVVVGASGEEEIRADGGWFQVTTVRVPRHPQALTRDRTQGAEVEVTEDELGAEEWGVARSSTRRSCGEGVLRVATCPGRSHHSADVAKLITEGVA